jgi:glutamate synthase domain-containing protein 1
MMDTSGKRFSGEGVVKAIANMHVRGNGLGGGFSSPFEKVNKGFKSG